MPGHANSILEDRPPGDVPALAVDGLPGFFTIHFQPEFDLATNAITGSEALLRWSHPEYGWLRPGASLQQSRWSDVLADAEDWATGAVADEVARWHRDGVDLQVALNVSSRQLEDPGLATTIERAVERSGARPSQLRVDVPVGAFTTQRLVVVDTVRRLADLGIAIVADGVTGDPRQPLDGMPISFLKVNIHVGRRIDLAKLHPYVGRSVRLAQELGAITVAKAVRRTYDLEVLRVAGFDRAFGDALSPALPAAELLALSAPG